MIVAPVLSKSGFKMWQQVCSADVTYKCLGTFKTQNPRRDVCGPCMQELKERMEAKRKVQNEKIFTHDDHPNTGVMTVLNEKERWLFGYIGKWT